MLRQRLLASIICLVLAVTMQAKVCIVAVGVADYPGRANDLRLPTADARTITNLYKVNTSTVYSQILNSDATCGNIIATMKEVYKKAQNEDIIVFYFSGHGVPGGFVAYDGIISYSDIRSAMAVSKCKNKMIFADACFSGKMSGGSNSTQQSTSAKSASVMLFLSSRANETSLEKASMNNGLFTAWLERGLRGGADANKDRIITAREIYDYVHKGVINTSANKQHPVMWGRFSDNMPVMKWNKTKKK